MSAQFRRRRSTTKTNQFIRPTSTIATIDIVSAARRLASRGSGFRASEEVAAAVAGGVAAELADALMVALGPRLETLSSEDVIALFDRSRRGARGARRSRRAT